MPVYESPGPVARAFRKSNARRRIITGPFGSGKSVSCVIDIITRIKQQKPNQDGVRKSRWAVIRNTYPDIKNTTVRTWKDWIPEDQFGTFVNVAPFEHRIRFECGDGTRVEADVIFIAMDNPADVKKFLSLEVTGIYFNEVREIHKTVVEAGDGRIGRYPSMRDGGPSWHGIIADTNMPDEDHWLYELAEGGAPGWEFFHQPGGVIDKADHALPNIPAEWTHNPQAENLNNLVPGYYTEQLAGKSSDWVKVYLAAQYGSLPIEGSYYAQIMADCEREGRVDKYPWIKEKPVHTYWDLGRTDDTAIWFVQFRYGEIRVIDYHESFGHDVPYYAKLLQGKPYTYGKFWLPHDAKAETLGAPRSVMMQMADFFKLENIEIVPELSVEDGIQSTRVILPRCVFNKDTTAQGRSALKRYRRKYNEERAVYGKVPQHDSASHGADAFRMLGVSYLEENPSAKRDTFRMPTLNEMWPTPAVDEARI